MKTPKWILLVEDNASDADLAVEALGAGPPSVPVVVARDGVEALDCLRRRGPFVKDGPTVHPVAVLLDLKMPRLDGFQVLREIKGSAGLKRIPVVVLTTSNEEADLHRCYELGANAYVVKPMDFQKFVSVLRSVKEFWGLVNELPLRQPDPRVEPPDFIAARSRADGEPARRRAKAAEPAGATGNFGVNPARQSGAATSS